MNLNIIEDEPAALLDMKVAFIDRAIEDGRLTIVNRIFAATNEDNKNDSVANIGGFEINRRQFKGLDVNGLVSEGIIDGFFKLLQTRNPRTYFFPVCFYSILTDQFLSTGCIGYEYFRKWFKNLQIFDYDLIIIPCIINNNHWILVTINCHYKEIKYYDTLNGSGQEVKRNIFEWLKQFSIVRYGTELKENE